MTTEPTRTTHEPTEHCWSCKDRVGDEVKICDRPGSGRIEIIQRGEKNVAYFNEEMEKSLYDFLHRRHVKRLLLNATEDSIVYQVEVNRKAIENHRAFVDRALHNADQRFTRIENKLSDIARKFEQLANGLRK